MQNFRPFNDLHNSKSTNKNTCIPNKSIEVVLPIKIINVFYRDKKGNIVYKGSSTVGSGSIQISKKIYSYNLTSIKKFGCPKRCIYINRSFNKHQLIGKILFINNQQFRITS